MIYKLYLSVKKLKYNCYKRLPFLILFTIIISNNTSAQTQSNKRGFCGNLENSADINAMEGISWYYNWYHQPLNAVMDSINGKIDFAAMCWGADYHGEELIKYLSDHPETKYLLAFNEPNFIEQANLGPKKAAALWPELQKIADDHGLKLISPAVNFSYRGGAVIEDDIEYTDPVQYLDAFFSALPQGSRVDYIAIHGYFDNAGAWPWYVSLFDKYQKPLWVTEFNHSAGEVTEISQQNFMTEAVDYFEKEPKIFRYSWFLARSTQLNTNLLVNGSHGKLTDLGLIFTNMSTYDESFYHNTDAIIEAEHYLDMKGVHLIANEDTSGVISVHDLDIGDWMEYQVDVAADGIYKAEFRITSVWDSYIKIYNDGVLLSFLELPSTDGLENWNTFSTDLSLEKGKQTLRLEPGPGGYRLNWWKLSKTDNLKHRPDKKVNINIYPNPVQNKIIVQTKTPDNFNISIIDINGKYVYREEISKQKTTVDITNLKAGTYIVEIKNENAFYIKQFIKL